MKKQQRRRTRYARFDFQTLEPRNMLAGDLADIHQAPYSVPADTNLVVNGDFEAAKSGDDNFYEAAEVAGWETLHSPSGRAINLIPYLQGHGTVLDLDSTVGNFDRIYQDIPTVAGKRYLISFDFTKHEAPNPTPTGHTYDFEVWWAGELIATYSAGRTWATGALEVVGGVGNTSRLLFCEKNEGPLGGGDGLGPLLDNIRVVEVADAAIENGSFETTAAGKTLFFRSPDVAGWTSWATNVADQFLKIDRSSASGPARTKATAGSQFLNLDSTKNNRDVVYQDLTTISGATYYVKFDVRTDGIQTDKSDELRVRWNNAWATTIESAYEWQSYGLIVKADSVLTRLMFLEPGDGNTGEGSGPWIDNVKLLRIDLEVTNDAPVFQQTVNQDADFGSAKSITVVATDQENDPITYSIAYSGISTGHNVPTISSNTGVISWTPTKAGPVELTVTATDSRGASSNMVFTVNVGAFVPGSATRSLTAVPTQLREGVYGSQAPPMTIDTTKNYEARFNTSVGLLKIKLLPQVAPQTVNNFVTLARDGFYDGLQFHRVIENFMAQGGDPLGTGRGGPGYQFADEISSGVTFSMPGLLAMANAGAGTNGSQFFITYGTPTHLNGGHTIFGEVIGNVSAFQNVMPVTHDPPAFSGGAEIPRPGVVKTVINSIAIVVTDPTAP